MIIENIGFQMDIAPTVIGLKDSDSGISTAGVEFVLNIGVNYYFK
jgi:hypothetical protein